MKYNNIPVLMTASVSTRGMKGACYSDLEREEMYLSTIKYYLKSFPGQRFVFAENSGWNLDDFKAKLLKSLKGSDDGSPQRGGGYFAMYQ